MLVQVHINIFCHPDSPQKSIEQPETSDNGSFAVFLKYYSGYKIREDDSSITCNAWEK
jgi:hypothetical protein